MRIAIVSEWWGNFGGAERTVESIHKIFPNADYYCLYLENDVDKRTMRVPNKESWIAKIPLHERRIISAPLSILTYRTLTQKKYDLVITCSHTFAHTLKLTRDSKTKYLSYVYTPARSLWLPEVDDRLAKVIGKSSLPLLRKFDRKLGSHVNSIASISTDVQKRVGEFWGMESRVIHPPVDLSLSAERATPEELGLKFEAHSYLVTAGRFVNYKNHDQAIRVAHDLRMPIVIMGSGPNEKALRELASDLKVEAHFLIRPSRSVWLEVLRNSYCFLFPTYEDFGITPVESLNAGSPVIALNAGGARDYIIDELNGLLVTSFEKDLMKSAIDRVGKIPRRNIPHTVQKFGESNFRKGFEEWVLSSIDD